MGLVYAKARLCKAALERTPRSRARRRGAAPRDALGIFALIFGGLAGAAAQAQIAPGYSGISGGGTSYMGDEETLQALRVFGACYARVSAPQALQLIATQPGTPAERIAVRQAIRSPQNCFGYVSRVRAPYFVLRGAVAEGLWKRRVQFPENLRQAAPAQGADSRDIYEAARCFAAAHGDRVRALLATQLGSRGEREAVGEIMSGPFRQCVPADAGAIDLQPIQARYVLVEALLRLPASPPATAGRR